MANHLKSHIAAHILLFVIILGLTIAYAGEYHALKEKTSAKTTETLACAQCHSMHGTQNNQSMVYGGTAGGNIKLLRHATILQLCLYCHDGNQASVTPTPPDIWGNTLAAGQTNPSGGNLCSGGADLANPPCTGTGTNPNPANNHTVDGSVTVTVPGSSPAITFTSTTGAGGFTCVNCHNPHGTTSYRNLRDNGTWYAGVQFMAVNDVISYSMSTTRSSSYYVNNLVTAGFGLAKYETSNVVFKKAPTTNTAGIQGFCKSCHTLFHGASGDTNMSTNTGTVGDNLTTPNPWLRHPTRDTSIGTGATNLHADSACWIAGTTAAGCAETFDITTTTGHNRVIDPDTTDENNATAVPFCLTCHRAHGSSRHSNLIYGPPNSVGGSSESATAMMRSTCQQCHNQ